MKQEDRSSATRAKLVKSARKAFASKGYAATSTPQLAKATGVSRGALYHHYEDKKALFRAVVEDLQNEVLDAIEANAAKTKDPVEALKRGSLAFLQEASRPEFVQIAMIDGPAVLGLNEAREIERATGVQSLVEGLKFGVDENAIKVSSVPIMASLISGMLNEGILLMSEAKNQKRTCQEVYREICLLIDGLKARKKAHA